MVTSELKRSVDALWMEFWQGGIPNPLLVIEQITFLMYARLLDINEARDEARLAQTGKTFTRRFAEDEQHLRWGEFRHLGAARMLSVVRDEVFPHLRSPASSGTAFAEFMKDAQLMVQNPSILANAVDMIHNFPLTDASTRGDLYEYLLSKLTTAGIHGQFRTPRHIIRLMVDMVEPELSEREQGELKQETVGDPACGTGGFLVAAMEYLLEKHTSPEGIIEEVDSTGDATKTFTGDKLERHREHIRSRMFHGFDSDATMLRIAAMNLMLHGVDDPQLHYHDTLTNGFSNRFSNQATAGFDVILTNPPFKGSLDFQHAHSGLLRQVKTKKAELLFPVLILQMLKAGGRSATIVPGHLLFGSSRAHRQLRKLLVDHNQLDAVVSLPSGVFKPYAGISTAILVFTKGGRTDNVFFYDVRADGRSLDDTRRPIAEDDLPDCLARWRNRDPLQDTVRTDKAFFVAATEIREAAYELSLGRYKEIVYEEEECDPPQVVLDLLKTLNAEIATDLAELEDML